MTALGFADRHECMSDRWEIRYLRHVEKTTGKSLSAIAKLAGVSSTTLTRPVNSPDHKFTIKQTTLEAVERATGIPFGGFRGDPATPLRVENGDPAPDDTSLVPVYQVEASAGPGSVVESEQQVHSLAFPPFYLRKIAGRTANGLAVITVKGDSMEPTLPDDSIVLVDTTKKNLGYDGLFVLLIDDVLHVKRIGRGTRPGHVMIISDNKDLHPAFERAIEDVEAIGKVLWYGRKV